MAYEFLEKRPLSWSAISSFEYSPDQWYRKYILGERQRETAEMKFGKMVGELLASEPKYLPAVPRAPIYEKELRGEIAGIPMVGFIDAWDGEQGILHEYKTGKKAWDRDRVQAHGQLDMYALLLNLQEGINPEDIRFYLHWMPTQQNGDFSISFCEPFAVHSFSTKRTRRDIAMFGIRIKNTVREMESYIRMRK